MNIQFPVLDLDQLNRLREVAQEESVELLQETLDLFIVENQKVLDDLSNNILEKDIGWISHKVHYIRGSASNIGLLRVSKECKNIELKIEKDSLSCVERKKVCQKLSKMCLESIQVYQSFIDGLKSSSKTDK